MSFIYNMADTWNAGGTTFNAIYMNVTNGAGGAPVGAAASRIIRLDSNGTPVFECDIVGLVLLAAGANTASTGYAHAYGTNNGTIVGFFNSFNGTQFGALAGVGWGNSGPAAQTVDTGIHRNAAGVVEVNNGTAGNFATILALNHRNTAITVASLAASVTAGAGVYTSGARLFVTNSSGTTFATTVTGSGGAVPSPIYSDGTQWRIG